MEREFNHVCNTQGQHQAKQDLWCESGGQRIGDKGLLREKGSLPSKQSCKGSWWQVWRKQEFCVEAPGKRLN